MTVPRAFVALLLAVCFMHVVHADIPVHCLVDQVYGEWQFVLGGATSTPWQSCHSIDLDGGMELNVRLFEEGLAMNVDTGERGHWTMIYDEGFELTISSMKLFSFFRYSQQSTQVTSYCNELQIGSYHEVADYAPQNWGCFGGHQMSLTFTESEVGARVVVTETVTRETDAKYEREDSFVAEINGRQLTWKAKVYDEYETMSMDDLHRMAGGRPDPVKKELRKRMASLRPASPRSVSSGVIPDGLPTNWDWRDVDAESFVTPVRNQGSCGSCFTFATSAMYESRLLIARGTPDDRDTRVIISPQEMLTCASPRYAQGCLGGFAYLMAKWGQDFGLSPETCMHYVQDMHISCDHCDDFPKYYVTDYQYIGGYFGNSTEEAMLLELYHNGPFEVAYVSSGAFHHYESGIFGAPADEAELTRNDWEAVDHSVLLIGYGEENGVPYWTCKNSWGADFGESGFFRIMRGTDESGIESMPVTMTVRDPETSTE